MSVNAANIHILDWLTCEMIIHNYCFWISSPWLLNNNVLITLDTEGAPQSAIRLLLHLHLQLSILTSKVLGFWVFF